MGHAIAMQPGYTIELAKPEHLPFLPRIEREAGALFIGLGLPEEVLADSTTAEEFRSAMRAGQLWVALTPERQPVGFAHVEELDDNAHLEELDVQPEHGRRGIGTALVRAVCDWAREAGFPAVTLTTFREVPWNAPFYARLGFRALASDELSEELLETIEAEAERGLEPEQRVVMRFDIAR